MLGFSEHYAPPRLNHKRKNYNIIFDICAAKQDCCPISSKAKKYVPEVKHQAGHKGKTATANFDDKIYRLALISIARTVRGEGQRRRPGQLCSPRGPSLCLRVSSGRAQRPGSEHSFPPPSPSSSVSLRRKAAASLI